MLTPIVPPSGSALATASVPVLPLAPGRFSIIQRLIEARLQVICDQPRDHVGGGAGGERHDDLHELGRPHLSRGANHTKSKDRRRDNTPLHSYSFAFAALRPRRIMPMMQGE